MTDKISTHINKYRNFVKVRGVTLRLEELE